MAFHDEHMNEPGSGRHQSRSGEPGELHGRPLLYDLHWTSYWAHWFAHHGVKPPDRYLLVTTPASRRKPEVRAFRERILEQRLGEER